MNTVAMEFITRIDEMLYSTLLPKSMQTTVAEVNFLVYKKPSPGPDWSGFKKSAFYFSLALTFVFCYASIIQNVLPSDLSDLKEHCKSYTASAPPVCYTHSWNELPTAASVMRCFPYGHVEHA